MIPVKRPPVIAITGAAGYIGRLLIKRLASEPSIEHILATDVRPILDSNNKVTYITQDINESLEEAFIQHNVEVVIHLAFLMKQHRQRKLSYDINVNGTRNLLKACRAANIKRFICLSSTTVYGAHPDNELPLTEESPLRPIQNFHYSVDKVTTEALLSQYAERNTGLSLAILRSPVIMGPKANNFITSALFKPFMVGLKGFDPPLQFTHETDIIDLIWFLLNHWYEGVFNVASSGTIKWSEISHIAGLKLFWIHPRLIRVITSITWLLRLQNDSPADGLRWIQYPWIADTQKLLKETSFRFRYTTQEALQDYLRSSGKISS